MKLITAGLISLSLLVSAFAEGNFGPAWVEGHHYEVKDGQLVDLGPTASPTPSPAPTSTPTPAPPTINIYNNVTTRTQQVAPAPAPAVVAPAPAPVVHDYDWVVAVYEHYQNHDDVWLTAFAQDGHTNYFGKRHASNLAIALDMRNDALHYGRWKATYYVDTFYRDVTQGITYDHIDMESSVYEYGVRWHSAHVRFTVGYTYDGSVPRIYALVYQVL